MLNCKLYIIVKNNDIKNKTTKSIHPMKKRKKKKDGSKQTKRNKNQLKKSRSYKKNQSSDDEENEEEWIEEVDGEEYEDEEVEGEEYDDDIKSAIADMKNVGSGRGAGATSGAKFIEQFTKNIPWVHIDIAGVTWAKSNSILYPTGGTGFGVRLLNTYVKDFIE